MKWQVSEEENRLIQGDIDRLDMIVEELTAVMLRSTEPDQKSRLGALVVALWTKVPPQAHALLTAMALDKLAAERGRVL
jgi:hypothetical protein